jgi:hypothetical protein
MHESYSIAQTMLQEALSKNPWWSLLTAHITLGIYEKNCPWLQGRGLRKSQSSFIELQDNHKS